MPDFVCTVCGTPLVDRGDKIDPCPACLADAEDDGYSRGCDDGYSQGYDDGYDACKEDKAYV